MESLRIFGILLRKSWLVRKRHWMASVIGEILLPVCLILCASLFLSQDPNPPTFVRTDSLYDMQSFEQIIDYIRYNISEPLKIMYAPSNLFIDELMLKVESCFDEAAEITDIEGFDTEAELIASYLSQRFSFTIIAIVFDETTGRSTKHLRYKLRKDFTLLTDLYSNLPSSEKSFSYGNWYTLVPTQICLDESFIKIKSNATTRDIFQFFIQQMPYPAHVQPDLSFLVNDDDEQPCMLSYVVLLAVAFLIPLFIETSRVTNEKFVGINIFMTMSGISNVSNLLSWIISGLLLLSVLCAVTTLLLFTSNRGNGLSFMNLGNPFIMFLVLILHVAHMITFGAHIAAYFSKGFCVTFGPMIVNILVLAFRTCVLEDSYLYLVPYVGVVFPNVLLYQALQEISSYETLGVQWSNLFRNTHLPSKIENSVGMILILSVAGTVLHFLLAVYVYEVYPGKYGVGKYPLLCILYKNKSNIGNSVENFVYDDNVDKYFEPTPVDAYTPGIQIRNLTKSFTVSLFDKKKVEALRGVSVDFYKGQITSLLGHNGAGKSTLMSILTGLMSPTDGVVLINSKNLKDKASEILKDMGLCTQEDMYFSSLTVTEQLEFLALIKEKDKSRSVIRENVQVLVQTLKLVNVRDALPNALSEDQRRKLCLGMAFVGNPSILVLDEPTARLDHESKRVIWDILLGMRGQKTILISTHDMEEADILGDRIAIMQNGRLKSYGTSLYLKKMIAGQNNIDVTLSIEKWIDPDSILTKLHKDGVTISKQDGKIVVSIPNTPRLSDYLDNLAKNKEEFGISGYSLSVTCLEQVFLKVTQEDDNPPKPYEIITSQEEKLRGMALSMQWIRALLSKKLSYAAKDLLIIHIQALTAFAAFFTIFISLVAVDFYDRKTIDIKPDMYDNPYILYRSSDKIVGDQYRRTCQLRGGNPIEINSTSLREELLRRANEDPLRYSSYLIAAAEFNRSTSGLLANAVYSERAMYSLPISINLLWNSIVASTLGEDHSITLSSQDLPKQLAPSSVFGIIEKQRLISNVIFLIIFNFMMAMFAIHPSRESSSGIKRLQKMTGVSGLIYWGTMFVSDFIVYIVIVLLSISTLVCMDYLADRHLYQIDEIMTMTLLFMLFAINALPIVYVFSFIKTKTKTIVRLLTFIPMGIAIFKYINYAWTLSSYVNSGLDFALTLTLRMLPYVSLLEGLCSYYEILILKCMHRRALVDFNSAKYEDIYSDFKTCLICLCVTPIIYFGILTVLEAQFIERIKARCFKQDVAKPNHDEHMQYEKSTVANKIALLNKRKTSRFVEKQTASALNNQTFLAYELRKDYKNVRAVEDVSFGISRGECFGLFGVNGSGKSVILRIITGVEIVDHGVMYIEDKDFKNNERHFLSQMGYCPQRDVTLKCLNSRDHLRLFARLRGIPEARVEKEVDAWIERLNLQRCASLPSSTYSSGNRQRLNIAIALIGDPKLVLLDEPTTRVDPGARRSFWNTIKSCQLAGQSVLLASHNMDECEALCERTAVMLDGKLICIGSPTELKRRFGAGYDVQIRMDPRKFCTQADGIKMYMRLLLHCVLTNENPACLTYYVIGVGTTWKKIYEVMDKIKSKYDCIDDFLVVVRLST